MTKADSYGWSENEESRLRSLAAQNKFFYTEIAEKLGKTPQSVRYKAKQLGLTSTQKTMRHRYGGRNVKHAHLREEVMTYFLTHTWEQTQKHFGLTASELKSLFTYGYRDKKLRHLRKETRTHAAWSAKELKFLLQHAGLRPRKWIMAKIKRGNNVCHIKERLQALGVSSRTLQGLTLSQFRQAFGVEPRFYLQTDAGPDGGSKTSMPTRWKIIPWVWLDQELKAKRLKIAKEFRILIHTRAMFQEWIFEGSALRKMKRIVKGVSA